MVVDFPDGGANPRVGPYANLLFGTIVTENCIQMKEKKYGSRGGACVSPPRSATDITKFDFWNPYLLK